MTMTEKMEKCIEFFNALVEELGDSYEVVGSCNNDISRYLIPKGTVKELTYSSKPSESFRMSDHWNWYANIKKCPKEHYIQCWSVDVPYPRKRKGEGLPSEPRRAMQIAYIGLDTKYHIAYGDRWNKKTKTWEWFEQDPKEFVERFLTFQKFMGIQL